MTDQHDMTDQHGMTDRHPTGGRRGVQLRGIGAYRPVRVVTNDELALRVDTSDEWIRSRTGIARRHIAGDSESLVEMGIAAGGKALAAAGLAPEDVDLVLATTATNLLTIPGVSPRIAHRLGATRAGALDLNGGCAGFSYGLAMGADAIRGGSARHVLVLATERLSDVTDWDDRRTCVLFADGAGAIVLGAADDGLDGVGPPVWGHDGSRPEVLRVPGDDDRFLRMEGQAVYRWAIGLAPVLREALRRAGVAPTELAAFVPHQANLRIIEALARTLGAPQAVVADDIVEMGNTSSATIPLALSRLVEEGAVRRGDPVLLFAFGAGLSYCGQVVRAP